MTTLYTAKKYAVPALEAHCVEFLKKNLRADNAFMLLTQVRGGGAGPRGRLGRAVRPGGVLVLQRGCGRAGPGKGGDQVRMKGWGDG